MITYYESFHNIMTIKNKFNKNKYIKKKHNKKNINEKRECVNECYQNVYIECDEYYKNHPYYNIMFGEPDQGLICPQLIHKDQKFDFLTENLEYDITTMSILESEDIDMSCPEIIDRKTIFEFPNELYNNIKVSYLLKQPDTSFRIIFKF